MLSRTVTTTRTVTLVGGDDPTLLASQTDSTKENGGPAATVVYSRAANTVTRTSAEGRVTTSMLDALGRIVEVQVAAVEPIEITYTIAQGTGAAQRLMNFTYNVDGRVDTMTDPLGRVTEYIYDAAGRVTTLTLPGPRDIALSYDDNGNTASITPPGKTAHSSTFTPVDLLDVYTPPDVVSGTDATDFDYNLDRQLTQVARPDAATVTHNYDSAGRPSTTIFPRGTITRTYSATTGQLTTMTAPGNETLSFTWDGPLISSVTSAGTISGEVSFGYDNGFNLTSLTVNDVYGTSFSYDNDDLLTSADFMTLTRSPQNGSLTETSIGSVSTTHTYDDFGTVESDQATYGASTFTLAYTRDKLGRITRKDETIDATTTTFDYHYTLEGFLDQVKTNGVVTSEYTYDANGNRLTGPLAATSCTYDAQDRLSSCAGIDYSYTANGELSAKNDTLLSEITTYDIDELGSLVQVELPDATTIDYVIDAQNRRIGKKIEGVLVQGFLWESKLRIAAELDGAGNVVSQFVYGTRVNVPDVIIRGFTRYRVITDQVGSVRFVVNTDTGAVAQEMNYDEFGNVVVDTNPGFQPFGFAGGLYDPDTGFVRFGARDYDPQIGRWTAKDPIRFAGGDTNLYAYVKNDPINKRDVDGLFPEDIAEAGIPELLPMLPSTELADAAFDEATQQSIDYGLMDTAGDAFRHCMASCRVAEQQGPLTSIVGGQARELWALRNQPPPNVLNDMHNNMCGVGTARRLRPRESCAEGCLSNLNNNRLITREDIQYPDWWIDVSRGRWP